MSEWQQIETFPKGGETVLICTEARYVFTARWEDDDIMSRSFNGRFSSTPTHWMPFPSPPPIPEGSEQ